MTTLQEEVSENIWTVFRSDFGSRTCPRRPFFFGLGVVIALTLIMGPEEALGRDRPPFRVAFSASIFAGVNENDALAAVKVWAQVLAKERELALEVETTVLNGAEALDHAMRSKLADAVGLCSDELWILSKEMKFDHLFLSVRNGRVAEEYILLVHKDKKIEQIDDLRGRSLVLHSSSRMSLASAWLETLLAQDKHGRITSFFNRVNQNSRLSQVILPVFFRKIDACLVTRSGFATMTELNPQIGRQLKVIASSPELVPVVFCFRDGVSLPYLEELLGQIRTAHTTVAGQQALTIFQCDRLEERPASALQSAFDLLDAHSHLPAAAPDTKPVPLSSGAEKTGARNRTK